MLAQARDVVVEHEEELGNLDAIAGDGDHGIGMRRGVDAAAAPRQQAAAAGASVERVLDRSRGSLERTRRRNLRGLWGSAVIAAGLALGNRDAYRGEDAAAAVTAFVDAITALGKAEPGDKTMVDALLPFRDAFLPAFDGGTSRGRGPRRRSVRRPGRRRDATAHCARSRAGRGRWPKRAWATPTPALCPSG